MVRHIFVVAQAVCMEDETRLHSTRSVHEVSFHVAYFCIHILLQVVGLDRERGLRRVLLVILVAVGAWSEFR